MKSQNFNKSGPKNSNKPKLFSTIFGKLPKTSKSEKKSRIEKKSQNIQRNPKISLHFSTFFIISMQCEELSCEIFESFEFLKSLMN